MSRSFKKTPGWCDRNPFAKRQANKKVRRYKGDLPNGKGYRKLYCPWNICDWKFLYHTYDRFLDRGWTAGQWYKARTK
jgi:hypothetical protein